MSVRDLIRRRRLQLPQPAFTQELLFDQFVAAFALRRVAGQELGELGPIFLPALPEPKCWRISVRCRLIVRPDQS
jgi:hypothetical protein